MPSLDSHLVQPITSGGVNAATAVTSLGSATTAENTLLILACTYGTVGITTPSGYTLDTPIPSGSAKVYAFRKSNIAAGETLPTLGTSGTTQKTIWFVLELTGIELVAPKDVNSVVSTATAQSIAMAGGSGSYFDCLGFSLFLARNGASTTPPTWSGYTGAWLEVGEQGAADATTATGAAVACSSPLFTAALPGCTATSTLPGNDALAAVGVKYVVAGATAPADLRYFTGFEYGTLAGAATGLSGGTEPGGGTSGRYRLFETITGSPTITTSTPRTGAYCLELPNTAAAHNLGWPLISINTTAKPPARMCFRFPGNLPTADTELGWLELYDSTPALIPGNSIAVRYRSASQKISVQIGANPEVLSVATVQADTWHTVDLEHDAGATGVSNQQCRWQLDGVEQTAAAHSNPLLAGVGITLRLGRTQAAAPGCAVRLDDCLIAGRRGNYPLGDHRIILLRPDPADTLTVTGSTANFNTFTANGTMAAWNAATARDAIRQLPPVIGASADGFAQVTTATGDYVQIPMETYELAANQILRGLRMLVIGWAAGTATKTIRFDSFDGTTATIIAPIQDFLFDNSTTSPAWCCALVPEPSSGWTQAALNALAFRAGFSSDATPDVGLHWLGAEMAVLYGRVDPVFGRDPDPLRVEAPTDPLTGGIIALWVYTPATHTATLTYELDGVEQTPVSVPAGSDPHEIVLRAADMPTVSRITLASAPA